MITQFQQIKRSALSNSESLNTIALQASKIDRGCRKTDRVGEIINNCIMAVEDDDYQDPSVDEIIDWMFSDPDARDEYLSGDSYSGD